MRNIVLSWIIFGVVNFVHALDTDDMSASLLPQRSWSDCLFESVNSCYLRFQDCFSDCFKGSYEEVSKHSEGDKKGVEIVNILHQFTADTAVPLKIQEQLQNSPIRVIAPGKEIAGSDHDPKIHESDNTTEIPQSASIIIESPKAIVSFPGSLSEIQDAIKSEKFSFLFGISLSDDNKPLLHLIDSETEGSYVSSPVVRFIYGDKSISYKDFLVASDERDDGTEVESEELDKDLFFTFLLDIKANISQSSYKEIPRSARASETRSTARNSQNGELKVMSVRGSTNGDNSSEPGYHKEAYENAMRTKLSHDFEQKKEMFDNYEAFLKTFIKPYNNNYVVKIIEDKSELHEKTMKIFSDPKLACFMLQILFPDPSNVVDKYLNLLLRANDIQVLYSRGDFYYKIGSVRKEFKVLMPFSVIRQNLRSDYKDVFMIQDSTLASIFK